MPSQLHSSYQSMLEQCSLVEDARQRGAIDKLVVREDTINSARIMRGLYLHGRVGRGKTLLMDMFYDSVATPNKLRLHFHHFMLMIHQRLKQIQGQTNPLDHIAMELASRARLICFDEFIVNDIADAMLLGGIFNALHRHNVMIVVTSNTAPNDLYAGGLARDRFLPTIDLINQHLEAYSLDGDIDYRTTFTQTNRVYFKPDSNQLLDYLAAINLRQQSHATIELNGRELTIKGQHQRCIWFDFFALCDGPRSQNDYIALANRFDVLVLSDIPQMGGKVEHIKQVKGIEDGDTNYLITPAKDIEVGHLDDCARRFIALIDEFYDRQKLVIISSECPMNALYQGGRVAAQFRRTESRLTEMQSIDYQDRVSQNSAKKRANEPATELCATI